MPSTVEDARADVDEDRDTCLRYRRRMRELHKRQPHISERRDRVSS